MPEATLVIDLDAQRAIRGMDRLQREMKETERAGDRLGRNMTDTEKQIGVLGKSFTRLGGLVKGGLASLAAGFTVGEFIRVTDEFKSLESQLRLVTDSENELLSTQAKLNQIANETVSSYGDTVTLYARLKRATQDLDVSDQRLLQTTEAINNAFRVSGASAEEASNAIIQLSQGLASGTLRGDEFNSVAEQAPRLLAAVAEYTGRSAGELRDMAAEGEITADVIINSLVAAQEELRMEAEEMQPTVTGAFRSITDQVGLLVSKMDDAVGVTDTFASALKSIGTGFTQFNNILTIGEQLENAVAPFRELRAEIEETELKLRQAQNDLANRLPFGPNDPGVQRAQANVEKYRKALDELTQQLVAGSTPEIDREKFLAGLEGAAGNIVGGIIPEAEVPISPADQKRAEREAQKVARAAERERARREQDEGRRMDEFFAMESAKDQAIFDRSDELAAEEQAQKRLLQTYLDAANPLNEYTRQLAEITELRERFPEHAEALIEAEFRLQEQIDATTEKTKAQADATGEFFMKLAEQSEQVLAGGIFDALQGNAQDGFQGIADGWKKMLDRMVADALASQVMDFFRPGEESGATGGKGGGGIFGSLMGMITNFLPGRASGGPVVGGSPYIVGEQGPELFVPKTSGEIVANAGGPGGSTIINMNISGVQDAGSFKRNEGQLMNSLQNRLNMSGRNM